MTLLVKQKGQSMVTEGIYNSIQSALADDGLTDHDLTRPMVECTLLRGQLKAESWA